MFVVDIVQQMTGQQKLSNFWIQAVDLAGNYSRYCTSIAQQIPVGTSYKCRKNYVLSVQAMLNPDYKKRPIAEAVLNHQFITGAVL